MNNIIETVVGPMLDFIGTRTADVETEGNITTFIIFDKKTNKPIGNGIRMVRDGIFTQNNYDEKSTLRKSVFGGKQP